MNKPVNKKTGHRRWRAVVAVLRVALLALLLLAPAAVHAQRVLTLDSCRALALSNNKQLGIASMKQEMNESLKKSARAKYLPHLSAVGGYLWMSKEISLLNNDQKNELTNLGTNAAADLTNRISSVIQQLPAAAQAKFTADMTEFAGALDMAGTGIVNALRTDTRNLFGGAVMVTQPVYMGGAIVAANKIADINVEMAANALEAKRQGTIYSIDQVYWQVVSLRHKLDLAESYMALVRKLRDDVQKLVEHGVAIKGDYLSVGVRLNEAEMAVTQVSDGLALAKMLLCQLCGLPVDEPITLADETTTDFDWAEAPAPLEARADVALANRPELKVLRNTVALSEQTTKVLRAGNLPQVLLTGGYAFSNPNTFNGFEKKFGGFWNIGVLVRIPIWNWGDVPHKVRASKVATAIANMELDDARQMVELQVNQSNFKLNEARKKLTMATANVAHADENLRMANLAFKEGTAQFTTVMEAQTAWQLAQTRKIDAEIGLHLAQSELDKALGTIQ